MLPKPHALEYTIFGKFRMQAGGSSFKDTYFFTLRELSQGGQSKAKLKEALLAYEGLQAAAECAALGDVSTDDEAGEEEEEREERVERWSGWRVVSRRLWGEMVWRIATTMTAMTAAWQRGGTGWRLSDCCAHVVALDSQDLKCCSG